ncbi:MAG: DNA-methyltransferase [Candidatus Limnocylindrales bacterium]
MRPYYQDDWLAILIGDCRERLAELPAESVHCVVTSPPYWGLRDYGEAEQLGLEPTPEEYVANMVDVFRAVKRVLRNDGTLWLNIGDSYVSHDRGGRRDGEFLNPNGVQNDKGRKSGPAPRNRAGNYRAGDFKPKDLVGIPWMLAFALRADGWYLRCDIIWAKPNPMPESVTDRPTKSHEYVFLLSKSARYYYDGEAVREPAEYVGPNGAQHSPYGQGFTRRSDKQAEMAASGSAATGRRMGGFNNRWDASEAAGTAPLNRNLRSVWTIATQPYPGAHFATFPQKLVEPCIKAGSPVGGTVLDPFAGSGTTLMVAQRLSRRAIGIDLSADYVDQALTRNAQTPLGLGE